MILPAEELVLVQLFRQMHFVARTTEFRRFVKIFQERFLVKRRFGFHQLIIHPLQKSIVTVSKWIMDGFFNGIVAVATHTVDVRNGMTGRAGNSRLRGDVVDIIKIGIIKGTAEEGDRIVAAGTEAGCLQITITFEGNFAGFSDRSEIGWIIKRAEMMHAVFPVGVCIGMTFLTIVIHHHRFCGNEVTCRSPGE